MKRIACAALAVVIALACAAFADQAPARKAPAQPAAALTEKAMTDINSATKDELMKLPGIGDALSARIIQGRPYRSKDELVRKKIIPKATNDKVKDMIIAKQK